MHFRQDIEFHSGDVSLKGWFYTPSNAIGRAPCIIMTHGFSALKEHGLDKFASCFAAAGLCVLVYDNRNFGESGGQPRLEVDPIAQVNDMRQAITFVQTLAQVDANRIGLWGTSFSGGVVLAVAAQDKRVRCLVAQVPFVQGHHRQLRTHRPEQWQALQEKYLANQRAIRDGQPGMTIPVARQSDNDKSAVMKNLQAYPFFSSVPAWENKVTFRSVEKAGDFEPIQSVVDIGDIPALFIVARQDTVNPAELALHAYEKAAEPKKLVMIEGDHFSPYEEQFETCSDAARNWYLTHFPNAILVR